MPSHSYELTTDQDPEAVWDALAPLPGTAEWMPLISKVEHRSGPDPMDVGTRYAVTAQSVQMEYECVTCQRPTLVEWKINDSSVDATDRWEFEATPDGGTHVTYHTDQKMKGIHKLTTPVGALALIALDVPMRKAMQKRVDQETSD